MNIKQIYDKLQEVGCFTFSTVNKNGYPESRIAHFRAYDEQGVYFMTMYTKPFYDELKATKKLSVCGMSSSSHVEHTADGKPIFNPGFVLRLTGDVEEVPMQEIKDKNDPIFDFCIYDQTLYPAMVVFRIHSFKGDIFDFDFKKVNRDNKLQRQFFSFGNFEQDRNFLQVTSDCIKCGKCVKACSFDAMQKVGDNYVIDTNRCDECGNCIISCPKNAIKKL